MGYDRCDSFPFDFEPNGIPFVSKSKEKLSPQSFPIQCERKWKHSFLSVLEHVRNYETCAAIYLDNNREHNEMNVVPVTAILANKVLRLPKTLFI